MLAPEGVPSRPRVHDRERPDGPNRFARRSRRHAEASPARSASGVTLVEVMIAAGLFGLLFASLLGTFENLLRMNRLARDMTRAAMDAEEILFALEKQPFEDLRAFVPPDLDNLTEETVVVAITGSDGGSIDPADPLPSLVRIEVKIEWKVAGGDLQRLVLHTLRGHYS